MCVITLSNYFTFTKNYNSAKPFPLLIYETISLLSHQDKGHTEGQTQPRVPRHPILWSLLLVLNVTVVVKAFEKCPTWIAPYKCRSSHHIPSCLCQRPRLYYITAHCAHRSAKRLVVRPLFALKQEGKKREKRKGGRVVVVGEGGSTSHKKTKKKKQKTDVGRTACHCCLGESCGHVALYEEQWTRRGQNRKILLFSLTRSRWREWE